MNGLWRLAVNHPAIMPRFACQFVIGPFRTAPLSRSTNPGADGGFDEDDVLVALSQPVMVLGAFCAPAPGR